MMKWYLIFMTCCCLEGCKKGTSPTLPDGYYLRVFFENDSLLKTYIYPPASGSSFFLGAHKTNRLSVSAYDNNCLLPNRCVGFNIIMGDSIKTMIPVLLAFQVIHNDQNVNYTFNQQTASPGTSGSVTVTTAKKGTVEIPGYVAGTFQATCTKSINNLGSQIVTLSGEFSAPYY